MSYAELVAALAERIGLPCPELPVPDALALDGTASRFLFAEDDSDLHARLNSRLAGPSPASSAADLVARFAEMGWRVRAWAPRGAEAAQHATIDATRTAFRESDVLVASDAATGTTVAVGESLALGLDFGAVLERVDADDEVPSIEIDGAAPSPLLATLACVVLDRLREGPSVFGALAQIGERIRVCFAAACARENIDAHLEGDAGTLRFVFAGQEGAEAPLMLHYFGLELEAQGIGAPEAESGAIWLHPGSDLEAIEVAVDAATARMRTLLVEHNSYLCGQVAYPFEDATGAIAARGLALYRYPKLAEVDLLSEVEERRFRIRFLGGELGEVTSSGFYLPTLFSGDFEVTCRYAIHAWDPGEDTTCFALFAQNEASTARYYAMRLSSHDAPDAHRVLGQLDGVMGAEAAIGNAPAGFMRVCRQGGTVSSWHKLRESEEWQHLSTTDAGTRDNVLFGAKIWAKQRAGRIEATVHDLAIRAELAAEQVPALEHRPDPR